MTRGGSDAAARIRARRPSDGRSAPAASGSSAAARLRRRTVAAYPPGIRVRSRGLVRGWGLLFLALVRAPAPQVVDRPVADAGRDPGAQGSPLLSEPAGVSPQLQEAVLHDILAAAGIAQDPN